MNEIGPNFIARPYRGVSVQDVETLEPGRAAASTSARAASTAAPSSSSPSTATIARSSSSSARTATTILVPVRDARVLAGPDDVAFIADATVDTGNATQLARAAAQSGRDARVYVVDGRFQHVNFIVEPAPLRIRVVEVVPPHPPSCWRWRAACSTSTRTCRRSSSSWSRSTCSSSPPRTRPTTTCSRAAAPGIDIGARGRLPRQRPARRGRLDAASAASARARSTPRSTAASRRPGRLLPAGGRGRAGRRARRCSSAACASAASSRRAGG